MKLTQGTILQNYTIIEAIGEGGMGEVYLAEETMLGRQVAIKRLNPSLTNDPQFSERFINEARIQAKLIHPNIVALYNFFVEEGVYYMVMEYAEGNMLKELIAITGPIPEARSLYIFRQIINALCYAHSKGVIHRDIKPSNIMIDANDKVKVMDFGIARLISDKRLTITGTKLGTLFYMSPEQVMAEKDIDHRTDIYSAGVVLYEMLTGKLPFSADTDSDFVVMKEITEAITPDPREVYPHIGSKIVAALCKATHKLREKRYQDCNEFYNDLVTDTNARIPNAVHDPGYRVLEAKPLNSAMPDTQGNMVLVEGGSFDMGNRKRGFMAKILALNVIQQVTLSSFFMGKYQVTQKEWDEIMGAKTSKAKADDLPAGGLSWFDAVEYCNKLSLKRGLQPCYSGAGNDIHCDWTANGYRLPSEAEWEYAARGGKYSQGYQYSGSDDIDTVAWYWRNSGDEAHEVGAKTPNELDLYDMSGNIWEWCWDWYGNYSANAQSNPAGPASGSYRVLRGGGWHDSAYYCRVADRSNFYPYGSYYCVGFRLCRTVL